LRQEARKTGGKPGEGWFKGEAKIVGRPLTEELELTRQQQLTVESVDALLGSDAADSDQCEEAAGDPVLAEATELAAHVISVTIPN
jgi:hypothetical protein